MTEEIQRFESNLKATAGKMINSIPLLTGLKNGDISKKELKDFSILLYGEARSSLRIKIPERIKMCPVELGSVRSFWCKMLKEESGGFRKGKDHATLIKSTCFALGANKRDLENSYLKACKRLENYNSQLFYSSYSIERILYELTQMWIDEHILAAEANNIGDSLVRYYNVSEKDVYYFRLHAVEDVKHSRAGLAEIVKLATTPELQEYVMKRGIEALENFPLWTLKRV